MHSVSEPPLVSTLTDLLGPPVASPPDHEYRVFIWDCPRCHAGQSDPLHLYRPFFTDSDGNVGCVACHASVRQLTASLFALRHATP